MLQQRIAAAIGRSRAGLARAWTSLYDAWVFVEPVRGDAPAFEAMLARQALQAALDAKARAAVDAFRREVI